MFNSYLAAIKFMEERDEYNEEDITKVNLSFLHFSIIWVVRYTSMYL